jgi:hypothetical protein
MRVLIVEDDPNRMKLFEEIFKADTIVHAENAEDGINALKMSMMFDVEIYQLVMLDHDLAAEHYGNLAEAASHGTGTGQEVAEFLARMAKPPYVIIHSWNPYGAQRMWDILDEAEVECFQQRFGKKLKNTIQDLREYLTT